MIKFRNKLIRLQRDAGWHFGLGQSYLLNARGARILVYHGICVDDPLRFNTLFIKQEIFKAQLNLYKKYCNIISLDDFYQQRFDKDRFNICLTFDDGFANNHRYVLPLLDQFQVPAAFFITGIREAGYDILRNDVLCMAYKYGPEKFILRNETFRKAGDGRYSSTLTRQRLVDRLRLAGFEEKAEMMELLGSFKNKADIDYWLQMTEEEIKALSASKWVTIGSHSYYHNDLAKTAAVALREDLVKSKRFLENTTGKEIKALAFPYGSYNHEVVKEAKNAGFTQLLTTGFLFGEDVKDETLRERLTVNPFISNVNQLHANIKGTYD